MSGQRSMQRQTSSFFNSPNGNSPFNSVDSRPTMSMQPMNYDLEGVNSLFERRIDRPRPMNNLSMGRNTSVTGQMGEPTQSGYPDVSYPNPNLYRQRNQSLMNNRNSSGNSMNDFNFGFSSGGDTSNGQMFFDPMFAEDNVDDKYDQAPRYVDDNSFYSNDSIPVDQSSFGPSQRRSFPQRSTANPSSSSPSSGMCRVCDAQFFDMKKFRQHISQHTTQEKGLKRPSGDNMNNTTPSKRLRKKAADDQGQSRPVAKKGKSAVSTNNGSKNEKKDALSRPGPSQVSTSKSKNNPGRPDEVPKTTKLPKVKPMSLKELEYRFSKEETAQLRDGLKALTCKVCNAKFTTKKGFKQHIVSHTDQSAKLITTIKSSIIKAGESLKLLMYLRKPETIKIIKSSLCGLCGLRNEDTYAHKLSLTHMANWYNTVYSDHFAKPPSLNDFCELVPAESKDKEAEGKQAERPEIKLDDKKFKSKGYYCALCSRFIKYCEEERNAPHSESEEHVANYLKHVKAKNKAKDDGKTAAVGDVDDENILLHDEGEFKVIDSYNSPENSVVDLKTVDKSSADLSTVAVVNEDAKQQSEEDPKIKSASDQDLVGNDADEVKIVESKESKDKVLFVLDVENATETEKPEVESEV